MSSKPSECVTEHKNGDTVAVFEWHEGEIKGIQKFVDQLNGMETVNPDTLEPLEIGEDWLEYEVVDHERHDASLVRHTINYSNVPDEFRSVVSGTVQNKASHVGMVIKQVDFENERFIVADQSLFESQFPDENDWIER